jgi:hypothetical protein
VSHTMSSEHTMSSVLLNRALCLHNRALLTLVMSVGGQDWPLLV